MNNLLFPPSIDNRYSGNKLALWLIWIVIILRGLQGLALIVGGPSIVKDADGIPLDTFPIEAAQSIVTVFMISGLSRFVLSLLCVLVIIRYKGAISLMLLVLALDQLGKEVLLYLHPLYRVGNPIGPTVNLGLLALTLLAFVLSIVERANATEKN